MLEPKEKVIGGTTFSVAPFPALEALRIKAYLLKLFGPALGQALGGVTGITNGKLDKISIGGESIAKTVELLAASLTEDEFEGLVRRLLKTTTVRLSGEGGRQIALSFGAAFETAMDAAFQGRVFSVYPVILFVLQVNYPDFFAKAAGGIGNLFRTISTSRGAAESSTTTSNESEKSESSPTM